MYFLLVIFIVGVLAIIGMIVSSYYRTRDGYKRVFGNGAPRRHWRIEGDAGRDSSFEMWPVTGSVDSGHHWQSSNCDTGQGGGHDGGSCPDGGAGADGGQ